MSPTAGCGVSGLAATILYSRPVGEVLNSFEHDAKNIDIKADAIIDNCFIV